MTQGLGKLATKRLVRRAEAALDADVTALEITVTLLALTPAFAFCAGAGSLFVQFGVELTAGSLDTSAWDITLAANGGAAGALTTTGSVAGADGLVALSVSGSPFKLPAEEEQAIVLAYTPSGTNDLKDAAGRTVAGFTYSSILPRISDWRKAAYMLMAEQASAPATPASGYGLVYADNTGQLHYINDGGTDATFATLATTLNQFAAPVASVNFNDQQALSFRLENRTSDPGSPTVGQIWLRTDL